MATLGWSIELELSALDDLDLLQRLVHWACGHVLDLLHDIIALENFTEDNVAAIEPTVQMVSLSSHHDRTYRSGEYERSKHSGDEELGAVGVLSGVGHAYRSQSATSHPP